MLTIAHTSGDWAEADTTAAAHVAAKTLIDDNGGEGMSIVTDEAGRTIETLWKSESGDGRWDLWLATERRDGRR